MSATIDRKARTSPRVLILGGGTVGLYAARRLRKRLGRREAAIVVVDPRPYMTYAPFLPETAAGSIDPRNVVAPHRRSLKGVDVLQGKVMRIEHAARRVQIAPEEGEPYWVSYDFLVVGLGSVARTLPIPGLVEQGIGFKNVEEAIAVRNHVLGRIDAAASTWDPQIRRRMLTFVFVGGGFAGVEAIAEVEDIAGYTVKKYRQVEPDELRFVLVEGSTRILPEVSAELGGYTLDQLRTRSIEIHLATFLTSCVDGHVVLSDGTEMDAETLVWTAGVKANPVLKDSDLPLDERGRVITNATLEVTAADGTVVADAFAAGDCAAVPDLVNPGQTCPPNAQHALRQGKHLGENLARVLRSAPPTPYAHRNIGAVASLGMYQGVAQMFGRFKVRGFPAWVLHRTYHVFAMPTWNRKIRIMAGWTWSLLLRREVIALGSLQDPRAEFLAAAVGGPSPDAPPAAAPSGAGPASNGSDERTAPSRTAASGTAPSAAVAGSGTGARA